MSLIERLRGEGGRLDSRGSFTLDVKKAREKMARFQLTDPRRYILELVQAGVALGADAIHVTTGSDVEVRFGGAPLPEDGLRRLDDFLLSAPQAPEEYALRAVAMALAALGALQVRRVVVESAGGFQLARTAEGETHGTVPPGTNRILVEGANGWSLVLATPEEKLLDEETVWSPVPVRVNGRATLRPALATLGEPLREERDGVRYLAGVGRAWEHSAITLVSRGVVVGRRQLALPTPIQAVVWHDRLGRNASHSDVVEDARYDALLKSLKDLSERLFERLAADGPDEAQPLLVLGLRQRAPKLSPPLLAAKVLRDHRGQPLSLADLQEQRASLGVVPMADAPLKGDLEGLRVVVPQNETQRALLAAQFGKDLQDAQAHVLRLLRRRRNMERYEASPRPAELPPGDWILRRKLPNGEVGLSATNLDAGSVLHVLLRGKLLESRQVTTPLSYDAVLDFAELEVDDEWSAARDTRALRSALEKLEAEADALYAELARAGWTTEPARRHLLLALNRKSPPEPFRSATVFRELGGGWTSVADLGQRLGSKGLLRLVGSNVTGFPDGLPPKALPPHPFVVVSPDEAALLATLFSGRTVSGQEELERLETVAERFRHRRAPVLEDFDYVKVPLPGLEGELGLCAGDGPGSIALLREGVYLEDRSLKATGPRFRAVVENPRLQPKTGWMSVETDKAWSEVVEAVRAAEGASRRPLVAAWAAGELPDSARRAVLHVLALDPGLVEAAGERGLLPSSEGLASLAAVQREVAEHGHVLEDAEARKVPGRLVLTSADEARKILPGLSARPAAPLVAAQTARARFMALKPGPVRVEGRKLVSRPFGSGEIALHDEGDGVVTVFHEGRRLCEVRDLLPPGVSMAVQDRAFQPNPTYDGVEGDLSGLRAEVGPLVTLALSERPKPGSPEALRLLDLLRWDGLPPQTRALLEGARLVRLLPDRAVTLAELRERVGERLLVVPPGSKGEPADGRAVVVADNRLQRVLALLLDRTPADDSAALERDRVRLAHQRKAAALPRSLPDCLVSLDVQGPLLRGSLGIPAYVRGEGLTLLRDDVTLGRVAMPGHPSCGVLSGPFFTDAEGLPVEPGRDARKELREHQVALYGRLAAEFDRSVRARDLLLRFAAEERSAFGGRTPASEVLAALLALPLVPAAGARRVSLSALVEEEARHGHVLFSEKPRLPLWATDRLLPILAKGSPERLLCEKVLKLEALVGRNLGKEAAAVAGRAVRGVFGWLGGAVDRLAEIRFDLPEIQVATPAAPPPREGADERLLKALRREFALVARGRVRRTVGRAFEGMKLAPRLLGAPGWCTEGVLYVNPMNSAVAYVRDHHEQDPAAVSLLVAWLVGLAAPDREEKEFLLELVRDLRGSYGS